MGNETNTTQLSGTKIIAFLIMVALIVGGIIWYTNKENTRVAKIWITSALKKYSTGTITDEDYDIEIIKSKSTKTREIYRIYMKNSSKLLLDSAVYVGLIKRSSGTVDETYVSTDLNQLYETINR